MPLGLTGDPEIEWAWRASLLDEMPASSGPHGSVQVWSVSA